MTGSREAHRDDLEAAPQGAIVISYDWKTEVSGVFARHADECPVRNGRPCTCGPLAYRASIREWENNRRVLSPDFPAAAEAEAWLRDQRASLEAAGRVALESGDLGAVVEEFLKAADDGRVEDPSGEPYSPDGLRELRGALSYVAAELGRMNIEDVGRSHVQHLVDQLQRSGLSAGRVDSVVAGLHALFSYASERDLVATDPVAGLTSHAAAPEGSKAAQPESAGGPRAAGTGVSPSSSEAGSRLAMPTPAAPDGARDDALQTGRETESSGSEAATPPARRPSGNRSRRPRGAGPTLDTVVRQFLRAADEGAIERRPGEPYTFETLLDLRGSMSYVDDRLRAMALGDIRRRHIQKLVDELRSVGLPSSVVVTVIDSLRGLYAYAIRRNLVDFSPVVELTMPMDDYGAEDRAIWSHAAAPPWAAPATPPPAPGVAPTPTSPPYPPPPTSPPRSPPDPQSAPAQPQHSPHAPNWQLYGEPAREAPSPTAAMMALTGRVVTWTTRLALVAFVLLVLVLARELGLTGLIP